MSDRPEGESRAVEELLRVNAELAAELRALSQGRAARPRSGPTTAARGLTRLEAEHEALGARLEALERELADTQAHREGLERQNQEMAAEIARLSTGLPGHLRKLRGRLGGR
jgi:predicted  nucleic acid-binding Zn-ribbon protein